MDIHQIMQSIGQITYLVIKQLGDMIQKLSEWVGSCLQGFAVPASPTVLKIFSNASVNKTIFFIVMGYILLMNIWAFSLYGIDKKHARQRKVRVSERRLISVCAWGGAGGGLLGMAVFSHKTNHKKFRVSVPLLFVVQLILYSFVLGFLGFWAFF